MTYVQRVTTSNQRSRMSYYKCRARNLNISKGCYDVLQKEFSEEFNTQSVMKEIDMGCLRITSDYRSQQCRRLTLEDVMAS